ncbi:hypothetical protein [Massilia sp. CCM 8734]|uniref:hypothetical protein n=1 Tax=Massilia sp. CCM 8734 TaxID=2609283 RepID=UPI001422B528|nr:hypothetical protein [Massilia sp. CCM 8734]NHZ96724.1 hypothetical protein [Massilia sp. CCM 8734]
MSKIMPSMPYTVVLWLSFLISTAQAAIMQGSYAQLGSRLWLLELNLINSNDALPLEHFSLYFPENEFGALQLRASPAGWDTLAISRDLGLPAPGLFDSVVLNRTFAVASGGHQDGFSLMVDYLGPTRPGALRFDILDAQYRAVFSGDLTPSYITPSVPEPAMPLMLIAGLALVLARRNIWRKPLAVALVVGSVSGCGNPDTNTPADPAARELLATMETGTGIGTVDIAPPGAGLTALSKLREERISRLEFRYIYKVTIKNGNSALNDVQIHLTSVGEGSKIEDGLAVAGNVASGITQELNDTITITHDRSKPFNASALHWTISAAPVGALGQLDHGVSMAGIDHDGNGVRDDIDRVVTELFTDPGIRSAATEVARQLQKAAVAAITADQARTTQIALERAASCVASRSRDYARINNTLMAATFNTDLRLQALTRYMTALEGVSLPAIPLSGACQQEELP